MFSDDSLQHLEKLADHVVQVYHPELKYLATTEGQKLPSQPRASFGSLQDLLSRPPLGGKQRRVLRQGAAVAQNYRQKIVEVMCDTAGESSDRLHFLRVA